jgi:hypothetical protein
MNITTNYTVRDNPDSARPDLGPCWEWLGSLVNGYACARIEGVTRRVHVWTWEQENGPVPEGLELDHLCRVRRCIRPSHLEPVTRRENLLRSPLTLASANVAKTHCPQSHPYDEANTYVDQKGKRYCRTCQRDRDRARGGRPGRRKAGLR